jgi:hypothetical protein
VLARAYATFPDALDLILRILDLNPALLPAELTAAVATGASGRGLDQALATVVDASQIVALADLLAFSVPHHLPYLRAALAAAHYRHLATEQPQRYRPDLADSLNNLGDLLWEVGRSGLDASEEAVAIQRLRRERQPQRAERDRPALRTQRRRRRSRSQPRIRTHRHTRPRRSTQRNDRDLTPHRAARR